MNKYEVKIGKTYDAGNPELARTVESIDETGVWITYRDVQGRVTRGKLATFCQWAKRKVTENV